jgi:methylmalonyl-CoA/ethylmalonyl-CoA epimerase
MQIRMTAAPESPQASVVEPLEFTSFSLTLDPGVDLDAVRASGGPVRLESDEQAWVNAEWLLAQEPYASDAAAREGVGKMLDFARKHGWVDDERGEIAAHVVLGSTTDGHRPGEGTMGISRIDNIGVAVRDLATNAKFFEDKLGLKVELYADGEPPAAMIHVGDQYLYMFQSTDGGGGEQRSSELVGNPRGLDHVSFTVDDVDASHAELRARGVELDGEPTTVEEWGIRMAAFRDPEGNSYFLVQNL